MNVSGLSELDQLICDYSSISNLNLAGCNQLTNVQATHCNLTALSVNGLGELLSLAVESNPLMTSLSLTNLPALQMLNANDCALTGLTISSVPALGQLSFYNNPVTSFDASGLLGLAQLNCYNCALSSLTFGNNSFLGQLDCHNNNLTTLDITTCPQLANFDCSNNNLTWLFVKNGLLNYYSGLELINFSGNPNLEYICADENETDGLHFQATTYGNVNCNVNSYCQFVPGGVYYTVQGSHKFDSNNNGCDASDFALTNLKFKITSDLGTNYSISGASGNYSLPFGPGTYTITPQFESEFTFFSSPMSRTVTFPTTASPVNQNFCITTIGENPDVEVVLLPLVPARPGLHARYKIVYRNKGNQLQSGNVALSFNDALLDFYSASPVPNTQTTGNLVWNFTNLLPFESREIAVEFGVNLPSDTPPVTSGTLLAFNAVISSPFTDTTPIDNHSVLNQLVVNSFDPNDKTCIEGTTVGAEMIGEYVHYMIRFENTGTANASNIVVKDLIDNTKFDTASLIPLSASHPYTTRISGDYQVEFVFEDINLPFDDAQNDGYIAFKIKTKPTLQVGDTFSNSANIYFDYNFPILTNTATTTISALAVKDFEFADYFELYPNPAHSQLSIGKKSNVTVRSIAVYNVLGQLVLAVPNAQQVSIIDVSGLKTGNYFIKINSDKGTTNAKFAKN